MTKAVKVPMHRIWSRIGSNSKTWYNPAFQGPGGLYGIRRGGFTDQPLTFQVTELKKQHIQDVSEPFMTLEGARRFAERLAEGGDAGDRFGAGVSRPG